MVTVLNAETPPLTLRIAVSTLEAVPGKLRPALTNEPSGLVLLAGLQGIPPFRALGAGVPVSGSSRSRTGAHSGARQ